MRKVLYSQKRYFLPQMTPPTQSELNQFRSTQQEGFEWIADAMWKDGRMATMKEMLERDPMNYELMVDKQMRKREHPLHHGIKAAFEKRLQYLKQQESKGDLPSGYEYKAGLEVPIGLTASQERVFLEMAAHNDEINKSFSGGGNKSRPPTYEEQYDNELNEYGVTRAQIKEFNRQGIVQNHDSWASFRRLSTQLCLAYVFYLVVYGGVQFLGGNNMYR